MEAPASVEFELNGDEPDKLGRLVVYSGVWGVLLVLYGLIQPVG